MNINNKTNYPPLQRRRRISDHASPVSPRRYIDRANRNSDLVSPAEATSGTDDSDSPSINLALASPTYDHFAALPTASPLTRPPVIDPGLYERVSEETGRPRFRTFDEAARPATSDAADPNSVTLKSRPPTNVPANPTVRPPVPYSPGFTDYQERKTLDPPIKLGEYTASPNLRNYNVSSPIPDRSTHDEPVPSKGHAGKKSRLNLLNPMSLLARRRSSQNQKLDDINLSISTLSVPALPDNFDPSIRGKVVHDFSAPRTRRQYSHNDIGNVDSPAWHSAYGSDPPRTNDSSGGKPSPSATSHITHSPMFKEHFQDDRPSLQPDRTGYLHNINAFNAAHDAQDPSSVPAFAKRLPSAVPQADFESQPEPPDKENLPIPPPVEPSPPPPTPPPKCTPSPKFDIPPPAALPKHMTSTSSRFSFQIGGGGSSVQEKLLEEKHKQHEATKKINNEGTDEEGDDYADYDFDADDDLEEKIPGINADFEEEEEEDGFGIDIPEGKALVARYAAPEPQEEPSSEVKTTALQRQSLQGFHFTPQSMTFSPTSTNNASQPTPRDHEGFAIGIADSRSSRDETLDLDSKDGVVEIGKGPMLGGLGITTAEVRGRRSRQTSRPHGQVFDDEDLYFDDGEFGPVEIDPSGTSFDEQIFDDETGKIRDIPAENARKAEAARQSGGLDGEVKVIGPWGDGQGGKLPLNVHQDPVEQPSRTSRDRHQISQTNSMPGHSIAGLTETNLAAYHDALAFAANQAAANGKFDRKVSFSQNSDDTSQSQFENSQHGVISDDSRFSYNLSSAIAEDDGFPFDDDLDDDPMIAEANAEALENDDEGFYGQEFGFYARSHGKGTSELVNGGYFADRGSNGVKRSHSGKANFQEPSLTPITERSEWSTRNSVASLQIPGGLPASAQSMPSPGIAQLLELDSPGYDDDMSFGALLKLRGRTFGGSSSSVNSLAAGHPASSSLAHVSNHSFAHSDLGLGRMSSSIHGRSSPAGIPESEEEEEDTERPTLTQNTPRKQMTEPIVVTSQEELPPSPASAAGDRRKGHHSRTSSGAESVSYARDTDGRWVMERRRTDEGSGEEVVDREYLAGTRI
ncbi:uncharacterized protein Z518_06140 [Rhinocladiella mackenziei CBS 650.93]|uniref:AGC-kinase C-terminal domain-containing protein n=1 Tax=Rhinocladiella mackenziei CBS 650.93 TaxID=1442369 RepID=A0A0D2H4C5_9EURO|nr:uncharacterized protein Z518_06140 [Rhinocladiella mackenziei CBS 650.93]KIX05268.1 hypothetical protein Z518_06140 [Rhinocladiella mackenziei CBS 650.93]